jgi:hypothetical protein
MTFTEGKGVARRSVARKGVSKTALIGSFRLNLSS